MQFEQIASSLEDSTDLKLSRDSLSLLTMVGFREKDRRPPHPYEPLILDEISRIAMLERPVFSKSR